jgi:hypothetical protein
MSGRAIVLRHLPRHTKVRSHTDQSGDADAGEHKHEAVLDRAVTIGFRTCRFPAWPRQTSSRGSTAARAPCPHRVPAQLESIRPWCARRRSGCHPCRSRAQSGVGARWKFSREGSRGKRPSAVGKYRDEGSEWFGLVDRCAQLGGSPLRNVSTVSQHTARDSYVTTSGSTVSTGVGTMRSAPEVSSSWEASMARSGLMCTAVGGTATVGAPLT